MFYKLIILILFIGILWGCQEEVDNYLYEDTEEYVDIELMTLLKENPDYSKYVALLKKHNIDTLFAKGKSITIFIPNNEAFDNFGELYTDTVDLIKYLITDTYINVMSVNGTRKIKTIGGKFALIETINNSKYIDGHEIIKGGPLCKNGRYYEIKSIAKPLPNLYEYISTSNPFFRAFIDLQDSVFLDLNLSTPIGYTEDGKTIYDSVFTVINTFSTKYFDIKSEFRSSKATMLLFDEIQFNDALSIIANEVGLDSKDDVPEQWKNDILFPYLINQGIFWNELEYSDFASGKIRNILGDTVKVDAANIDNGSEIWCSNGKAFNYLSFIVPDSLYKGKQKIQGENLIQSKGFGLFAWKENVTVTGALVNPQAIRAKDVADNDSILAVNFAEPNYSKEFSLSFKFRNIFPGTYRFIWRGRTTPSGIFEILINGELQKINLGSGAKDFIDLYDLRNPVRSFTKEVFRPTLEGYNTFDILIENITEYGDVEVTIRYKGPGQRSENGFILDYVQLENYQAP